MADFLSGLSVGAHRGLADLVASKRQNRQMARQQRQYENEIAFRIGSAAQSQRNADRAFAYQQAQDEAADKRWRKQFGLQEDAQTETERSNRATEKHRSATLTATIAAQEAADEDRDADRAQRQSQFEDRMADDWARFDENRILREEENAAAAGRFEREMGYKGETLAETIAGRKERNELTRGYYQSQKDYWDDQIRLKKEELNRPLTDLEKSQMRANNARAGYYDRMPGSTARSPAAPKLTAGQIDETLDMMAEEAVKQYTDHGGWGWLGMGGRLPWTDPSGKSKLGTQPEMLHKLGLQEFNRLMERFNDPAQAELHLERLFDKMLRVGVGVDGTDFGNHMRRDIIAKHPNKTMSDREKLDDARRIFISAWRTDLAGQVDGGTTNIRDLTVPRQHDFRNRGTR